MTMKKMTTALALLAMVGSVQAQDFAPVKKTPQLGVSGNLTDFVPTFPETGTLDGGFSVLFWKGITRQLDYSLRFNGIFSKYTKNQYVTAPTFIPELEWSLHALMLKKPHLLNPFLTAGLGIGYYGSGQWATYAPLGVGVQLNMYDEGYIFLQANYRASFVTAKVDNSTMYSLGFTQTLKKAEAPAPKPLPVPPPPADTDGDQVADSLDACPEVAGPPSLNGCPDSDGDGIIDKNDKCPKDKGLARYNGCPIPDTDKDGINDEDDKCITVAGFARYQGCPIPDTDKDGVNDEEDKCPNEAGVASNFGCPEIAVAVVEKVSKAAQNLFFATGSATLLAKSNPALNNVVAVLNENPNFNVDISGHTDNTGTPEKNQALSENRANAVKAYLVKKGIDPARITATGFAAEKPVADNKTAAGRSKNRRVEMTLRNY